MGHCMLCKHLESLLNLLYDATAWCGCCNLCVDKHMVVFIFAHLPISSFTISTVHTALQQQGVLHAIV